MIDRSGLTTLAGTLLVAFVTADVATRLVRWLACHWGVLDPPGDRKIHSRPLPRLGGLAIGVAFFTGMLAMAIASPNQRAQVLAQWRLLGGLAIGGSVALAVGALDDWLRLSAGWKFLGQLLVSLIPVAAGVSIRGLTLPLLPLGGDRIELSVALGVLLTIFWIVGMMNAMNFIDGADGLLGSVASVAALVLALVALRVGDHLVAAMFLAILGSCLGFLRHNRYPATIFPGDSGSQFLGYLFGALTVAANLKSTGLSSLLLPLLALGLPIFDSLTTVAMRAARGVSMAQAGRDHLHHKLLRLGYSQRAVSRFFFGIAAVLGGVALLTMNQSDEFATLCVVVVTVAIFSFSRRLDTLLARRQREIASELAVEPVAPQESEALRRHPGGDGARSPIVGGGSDGREHDGPLPPDPPPTDSPPD